MQSTLGNKSFYFAQSLLVLHSLTEPTNWKIVTKSKTITITLRVTLVCSSKEPQKLLKKRVVAS